jgi:hypothetical protein
MQPRPTTTIGPHPVFVAWRHKTRRRVDTLLSHAQAIREAVAFGRADNTTVAHLRRKQTSKKRKIAATNNADDDQQARSTSSSSSPPSDKNIVVNTLVQAADLLMDTAQDMLDMQRAFEEQHRHIVNAAVIRYERTHGMKNTELINAYTTHRRNTATTTRGRGAATGRSTTTLASGAGRKKRAIATTAANV